jgi:hypothetical protein
MLLELSEMTDCRLMNADEEFGAGGGGGGGGFWRLWLRIVRCTSSATLSMEERDNSSVSSWCVSGSGSDSTSSWTVAWLWMLGEYIDEERTVVGRERVWASGKAWLRMISDMEGTMLFLRSMALAVVGRRARVGGGGA